MISGPASFGASGRTFAAAKKMQFRSLSPEELPMDMNELFYRHQMALMAVGRMHGASARHADFDLSGHYADRIDAYRARRGMGNYFAGPAHPAAAIVGA